MAKKLQPANKSLEKKMEDMENYARQRLEEELRHMNVNPPTHCSYGLVDSDLFHWQGIIMGPLYTPFDGGIFNLSLKFPIEYPFKPPTIKFLTKVINHLFICWSFSAICI
uniref:Putative ubiquitin-conjugating enzyme E2 D1 n=1 Tax=Davidia involucrata TaxID=16924 RepID=A0A5B7BSE5_DAVIN